MGTLEDGLRTLQERVRAVEDRLEIYNLIAAHPAGADTGAAAFTASLWTENGVFDRGELSVASGRNAIANAQLSPAHQAAIEGGLGHFTSLPHITIEGDRAVATSYLQVIIPHPATELTEVPGHGAARGYHIHRASVNRWELIRSSDGWRVERRILRLVGTADARELLSLTTAREPAD